MENVRYNISPCSPDEAVEFVEKIDKSLYASRGAVMADEHSHYDRYSFVREDSKVAVVYDTSAQLISITAPQAYAEELLNTFSPSGRQVKRSTVPAQTVRREKPSYPKPHENGITVDVDGSTPDTKARVFISPDSIRRPRIALKTTTIIATSKGIELSTDEIFPPQRAKPRPKPAVAQNDRAGTFTVVKKSPSVEAYFAKLNRENGAEQSAVRPKKATITMSCGDDDERMPHAQKPEAVRSGTGLYADIAQKPAAVQPQPTEKRKRGRPRKVVTEQAHKDEPQKQEAAVPEYKNGYSVQKFTEEKLSALIKRIKARGCTVRANGTEFSGTPQEVRAYTVTDKSGSKVYLRCATNKMSIQLQGKRSELFGELQSLVGMDSDYSSALENYVDSGSGNVRAKKVSEVEKRLKKRLPTAYEYLSEQSRIDFSYGIHDFSQDGLTLSDYSVLLVPPYRGLERFVFDLQNAENIKVKMIGQAYDKDDSGNYVLKNGYRQRIGSVVYCEVMVALYTEYFSRRNFFAHSDNTDAGVSRAITDKAAAKGIFEHLLDVVEYNAKKLKEIGFRIK